MKRIFKSLVALTLAVILFTAPSTAFGATWVGYSDRSFGNYTEKEFVYSSADPLILRSGQASGLPNNVNNGGFYARAGQGFTCCVMFTTIETSDLLLYNQTTGEFVAMQSNTAGNFGTMYFTVSQSGSYIPILRATNGSTIVVDKYTVYVY